MSPIYFENINSDKIIDSIELKDCVNIFSEENIVINHAK